MGHSEKTVNKTNIKNPSISICTYPMQAHGGLESISKHIDMMQGITQDVEPTHNRAHTPFRPMGSLAPPPKYVFGLV